MLDLLLASVAFVGTHFLLSHPLRRPLVRLVGEGAFTGLYSLVAIATLAWMVVAYVRAPNTYPLWPQSDALWLIASVATLLASILLAGSLVGNPAFPKPGAAPSAPGAASGVYAITRHPMLWSFAIWGFAHVIVYPIAKTFVVTAAIIVLSLMGAALQDRKKALLQPTVWPAWERQTSYLPFAAIVAGRAHLGRLGWFATFGGLVFWLGATWLHRPLSGWPAGIWKWL